MTSTARQIADDPRMQIPTVHFPASAYEGMPEGAISTIAVTHAAVQAIRGKEQNHD